MHVRGVTEFVRESSNSESDHLESDRSGSVSSESVSSESTRREVLAAAGTATLGGTLSVLSAGGTAAPRLVPESLDESESFEVEDERATTVFPHSVASGGPTPSGVLL